MKKRGRERSATTSAVLEALERNNGNLAAAARQLGCPYSTLCNRVKAAQLRAEVRALRQQGSKLDRERVCQLLAEHQGNVTYAAEDLGIRQSSLCKKISRLNLWGIVREQRPRMPSAQAKKRILAALHRHRGVLSKACQDLGITRNTLSAQIQLYGLTAKADALRVAANISGPRRQAQQAGNRREQRAKLLAIIESCGWNLLEAQGKAGISNGTLYNRLRELGIQRPKKLKPEHRLQRLLDGLRVSRGNVERAAFHMKVPAARILEWCREFDIDPRGFRR